MQQEVKQELEENLIKLRNYGHHPFMPMCLRVLEERRHAHVIKQNGKVVKIKKGTHVKEILASNPRT
jgi:hypothetical protein